MQNAIIREYLPFLSDALLKSKIIKEPLCAVIRKGKARFVCDQRYSNRFASIKGKRHAERQLATFRAFGHKCDLDDSRLSHFDREQVCVPAMCERDCPDKESCRYHTYLQQAKSERVFLQICNHNYLLADANHRTQGLQPLLADYRALIVDEAHKLPAAARQMYGERLTTGDLLAICTPLEENALPRAAAQLRESVAALQAAFSGAEQPAERLAAYHSTGHQTAALYATARTLRRIRQRHSGRLPRPTLDRLERSEEQLLRFAQGSQAYILSTEVDKDGEVLFQADSRHANQHLQAALWASGKPAILTSGTLMAAGSFAHARREMGLTGSQRVTTFCAASPFDYEKNCLLYLPETGAELMTEENVQKQILELLNATHGHTLVLFTSYRMMQDVCNLMGDSIAYPLFAAQRHTTQTTIQEFKQSTNAVLFAAGSCWEGVDFPGDVVSSLIIVRLPFPVPDPISEAEMEQYADLKEYIQTVVIPNMQLKLRQGFGRAIRTETDTCAISILDPRAAPGGRYHQAVLQALPKLPVTQKIRDLQHFIRATKSPDYFLP